MLHVLFCQYKKYRDHTVLDGSGIFVMGNGTLWHKKRSAGIFMGRRELCRRSNPPQTEKPPAGLSLVSSLCTASLLYAYFCPSRYLPIPRTRPSAQLFKRRVRVIRCLVPQLNIHAGDGGIGGLGQIHGHCADEKILFPFSLMPLYQAFPQGVVGLPVGGHRIHGPV